MHTINGSIIAVGNVYYVTSIAELSVLSSEAGTITALVRHFFAANFVPYLGKNGQAIITEQKDDLAIEIDVIIKVNWGTISSTAKKDAVIAVIKRYRRLGSADVCREDVIKTTAVSGHAFPTIS